jgi:hypothetical protein
MRGARSFGQSDWRSGLTLAGVDLYLRDAAIPFKMKLLSDFGSGDETAFACEDFAELSD